MFGIFCKPINLWLTDPHTERLVMFPTLAEAQERADTWNSVAEASGIATAPYEAREYAPVDTPEIR